MKKITLLLIFCLCLSLTACGGNKDDIKENEKVEQNDKNDNIEEQTPTTTPENETGKFNIDTMEFEFQGEKIILGKTTFGEIAHLFSKLWHPFEGVYEEDPTNFYFVSKKETLIWLKNNTDIISLTIVSPAHNEITTIDKGIIAGIKVSVPFDTPENDLDLKINRISIDEKNGSEDKLQFAQNEYGGWEKTYTSKINPYITLNFDDIQYEDMDQTSNYLEVTYKDTFYEYMHPSTSEHNATFVSFDNIEKEMTEKTQFSIGGNVFTMPLKTTDFLGCDNIFLYSDTGVISQDDTYLHSVDTLVFNKDNTVNHLETTISNPFDSNNSYIDKIEANGNRYENIELKLYGDIGIGSTYQDVIDKFGEPDYQDYDEDDNILTLEYDYIYLTIDKTTDVVTIIKIYNE